MTTQKSLIQERLEGSSTIIYTGIGLGAAYTLWAFGAAILSFLVTTIGIVAASATLGVMFLFASNPKVRLVCRWGFNSMIRGFASLYTTVDPIGVLEGFRGDAQSEIEDLDKTLESFEGKREKARRKLAQRVTDHEKAMDMADAAQRANKMDAFRLNADKAALLEESNATVAKMLSEMDSLNDELQEARKRAEYVFQDLTNKISVKKDERELLLDGYSAFTHAKNLLNGGGSDKREMFDMACEALATDYAMKIGEIRQFKTVSKGAVESMDIESGARQNEAMRKLQEWRTKQGISALPSASSSAMLTTGSVTATAVSTERDSYADLIVRR